MKLVNVFFLVKEGIMSSESQQIIELIDNALKSVKDTFDLLAKQIDKMDANKELKSTHMLTVTLIKSRTDEAIHDLEQTKKLYSLLHEMHDESNLAHLKELLK